MEFELDAHIITKIDDGCIVLVLESDDVDDMKHEQEALWQQLREIKKTNHDIKNTTKAVLREGIINYPNEK